MKFRLFETHMHRGAHGPWSPDTLSKVYSDTEVFRSNIIFDEIFPLKMVGCSSSDKQGNVINYDLFVIWIILFNYGQLT